jgi:DEAD/DEAH box helicase domain-containing protein
MVDHRECKEQRPRILVFDVETNAIEGDGHVHVTVAVARWMDSLSEGCTCVVPSAQDDAVLHERFAPLLDAADAIVAFNGRGFDLRVLLRAHFSDHRERVESWARKLIDPFEVMRTTTGSWVKLDEVLEANGLPCKTGSGLDAIRWWAEGERDKVARYCEADVEGLRSLLALEAPLRFPIKSWKRSENGSKRQVVITGWAHLDWHGYVQRWWKRVSMCQ